MGRRIVTRSDVEQGETDPSLWMWALVGLVGVVGVGGLLTAFVGLVGFGGSSTSDTPPVMATPPPARATPTPDTATPSPVTPLAGVVEPFVVSPLGSVFVLLVAALVGLVVLVVGVRYYRRRSGFRDAAEPPQGRKEPVTQAPAASSPPPSVSAEPDERYERVVKTIPAEIITGWIVVQNAIEATADTAGRQGAAATDAVATQGVPTELYLGLFALGLLVTPLHMAKKTQGDSPKPLLRDGVRVSQIALGSVSFGVWAFSLGGPFAAFPGYNPILAAVVLAVYTWWLIPLFQPP